MARCFKAASSQRRGLAPRACPARPRALSPGPDAARVGNDIILASDVLASIDDMLGGGRGRLPPEKYAQQRAMFAQEIMDGINELKAHYRDPDPGKGVSPQHRAIIMQVLQEQIKIKLAYQDFRSTVPKDALPQIEEKLQQPFRREPDEGIDDAGERAFALGPGECPSRQGKFAGTTKSEASRSRSAGEWMREQLKKDKPDEGEKDGEEEVTHEEMLGVVPGALEGIREAGQGSLGRVDDLVHAA